MFTLNKARRPLSVLKVLKGWPAKIAWCRMDNRFIYAVYDDETIRVYQAYSDRIADEAIKLGTFGSAFKLDRMTWIKPSFLWMMYRSGWATKEGQNRILAIDMKRKGFDLIVRNAVLSSFSQDIYGTYENWKACLVKSSVRCNGTRTEIFTGVL
jgi:hypothetical protein